MTSRLSKKINIPPHIRDEILLDLDSKLTLAPPIFRGFFEQKAYEQGLRYARDLIISLTNNRPGEKQS